MFDWAGYLTLARELVEPGEAQNTASETKLRCAVSRAYYAAFGRATAYVSQLVGPDEVPDDWTVHQFVVDWFRGYPDRRLKKIGRRLDDLRLYRNDADYHANVSGWRNKAEASIAWASSSIDELQQLPGAPPEPA